MNRREMTECTVNHRFGDSSDPQASIVVLETLAQYNSNDVDDLDFRLYDVIDPDALNKLFSHQPASDLSVEFDIPDGTVTVWNADGEIHACVDDEGE